MSSFLSYIIISLSLVYALAYPFWTEINVKNLEKEKYEKTLADLNSLNQKKEEVLAQIDQMSEEDKEKINTFMPTSLDFVKLVSDINEVGSKYGITVDNVDSTEIDQSGGSISESQNAKPYNVASVTFTITSSYPNFLNFVKDLEKSLRILDIKTISLTPTTGDSYNINLELQTYWAG